MTADWVIVTAPADRGSSPVSDLSRALTELSDRRPDIEFRVAVLGGAGATVTDVLDEAAAADADEILVLSGQTLTDRKMQSWFRRIIGHWLREHPGAPRVCIGQLLTQTEHFVDLLDEAIGRAGAEARTTTAPITSPLWERVPGFSRHVLVCRGPRCSAQGGAETQRALADALSDRDLGDDAVLVTLTGCLFPCAQAPVVVVYPDDTWYESLTADRVATMVDDHLVAGRPVTRWQGARGRRQ